MVFVDTGPIVAPCDTRDCQRAAAISHLAVPSAVPPEVWPDGRCVGRVGRLCARRGLGRANARVARLAKVLLSSDPEDLEFFIMRKLLALGVARVLRQTKYTTELPID